MERFARFELAPLSDGTFRRRGLREALRDEFASVLEADTLGMLSQVGTPTLVVRGGRPWPGQEHWLTEQAFGAQLQACRPVAGSTAFEARRSSHSALARDPEPELIAAVGDLPVQRGGGLRGCAGPRARRKRFGKRPPDETGHDRRSGSHEHGPGPRHRAGSVHPLAGPPARMGEGLPAQPGGVPCRASVTEAVRAALHTAGPQAVLASVHAMAESIYEAPESWKPSSFTRDATATGYGRRPE